MTDTTRIKITISLPVKSVLEEIAKHQGMSLSQLILEAAIDRHIHQRGNHQQEISTLARSLDEISRKVDLLLGDSAKVTPAPQIPTKGRKNRKDYTGIAANSKDPVIDSPPLKATTTESSALENGIPLHIDNLIERFGYQRSLKARMMQLGGRDGKLFQGSLSHAQRVEEITSSLDPDSLPWMPVEANRAFWSQISAEEFCRQILTRDQNPPT
jgi:hypothetical protein